MHVVDGDLLKAARNQRPVLHIQHFIEQHHQQIIQKFFLLHASSSTQIFTCVSVYHISDVGATTDTNPDSGRSRSLFCSYSLPNLQKPYKKLLYPLFIIVFSQL